MNKRIANIEKRQYLIAFLVLSIRIFSIGDAYMGVTNLDGTEDNTHVKQVAEFSLELIEAAGKILVDEDDPKRGFIRIRVG